MHYCLFVLYTEVDINCTTYYKTYWQNFLSTVILNMNTISTLIYMNNCNHKGMM